MNPIIIERLIETGIPAFDSCLSQATRSGLHPGDVIHIQGPSGSGKTQLFYLLLLACCLPPRYLLHQLGGWNKVAFVLDMDGTFDIGRFHEVLVAKLKKSGSAIAPVIDDTLKRVHVVRPTSTEQLATTLTYLPKYHSKNSPDAVLGMVAIHSLDAFHWLDQFKAEQLPVRLPKRNTHQIIFTKLETLGRSHGAITLISHWGLPRNDNSIARPAAGPRTFYIQLGTNSTTEYRGPSAKIFARVVAQDGMNSFSFEVVLPIE